MITCLKWLCCCCELNEENPELPRRTHENKKQRKPSMAKQTRLVTKYKREDFGELGQQQRRKEKKTYCCPICFLYFKRILACGDCFNFICLACYEQYDKKNKTQRQHMKCPFCASATSKFVDYELDPHSYFDASKQGCFITKQQRSRVDNDPEVVQASNHDIARLGPAVVTQPPPQTSPTRNL